MIKVAIVDDQILLAKSLKLILESDSEIQVIKIGSNGKEAIDICSKLKPDVLLLDINMPVLSGVEATRIIKEVNPNIKVLILTTFENIDNIIESFISGADGYVVKDIAPEELVLSVKCAFKGLHVLHKSVHKIMINEFKKNKGKKISIESDLIDADLSPAEVEIIRLVSQGKTNREIASILCFAEGTIKNKISGLLSKLELRDRTQIAIFALENNII